MTQTPEREKIVGVPKEVQVIPETPEIPEYIEKGGVRPTPTQVTPATQNQTGDDASQVAGDTVVLPKSEEELEKQSRGDIEDAKTWWAVFVIRLVKKAIHFGKKVVGLNQPKAS